MLQTLYEKTGREAKRSGSGHKTNCPAHDDRNASLSIAEGDDGRALVCCHAGCTAESIVAALDLRMADLMPGDGNGHGAANGKSSSHRNGTAKRDTLPKGERQRFPTAKAARAHLEKVHGECAGKWAYHDADGTIVGVVLRWNLPDGSKTIRPIARVDGGWVIEAMVAPRPIYNLPAIASAERMILCEGEPAADAVRWLGFTATTSAGGANAGHLSDWTPCAGKEVVAWPDNDDAGRKYVDTVAGILTSLSPPATVRVLAMPELPPGGDAVDWLEANEGESRERRAEMLETLITDAPAWESSEGDWQAMLVKLSDVKAEPVRWL
jgi:putative DNA primase/helicase